MNATSIALIFDYARTAAFLALMLFVYADVRHRLAGKTRWMREAWAVAFFMFFTVLSMQGPVLVAHNVVVNFRAVAVSLAVLFGGPLAGFIAGVAAVTVRDVVGNSSNTSLGILLVLLAYVASLAYRQWIGRRKRPLDHYDLVLLGIGLDFCRVIAWLAIYGYAATIHAIDAAWLYVFMLLPLSVLLLGATILLADERHRLARSVADSETRFRNVLDQLPNSLTLVDLHDRYTFVNQTHASRTGIPPEEQIGTSRQTTWNRVGAGLVPQHYFDEVLKTGEPLKTEPTQIVALGKITWLVGIVFPVRDAGGEIKEIGTVGVDITDLWSVQQELARREDMLSRLTKALVEAVRSREIGTQPLAVTVRNLTEIAGSALGVERTAVFRFDLDTDQVERIDLWERSTNIHFPSRQSFRPPIWQATGLMDRDEVLTVEDVSSDPRMTVFAEHMRIHDIGAIMAAPIFVSGRFRGIITFSQVGSGRKWAIEEMGFARSMAGIIALSYLNDRHREALAALDLIEHGIYVEESDGRVIYANRVALKMADAEIPTAEGQFRLQAFPANFPNSPRLLEGDHDRYETSIDIGSEHRDIEIARNRLPGGGMIVLIRDLTRRNKAQRERLRLENQLLQASKLEAIGQLAGGVAHDFNNLLGAVMGFARFIEEDLPPDSNQHRYAKRILAACERGKAIVTQINSFSRARNLERNAIDLSRIVRDSADILAGLVGPSTELSVNVPTISLPTFVNEGQVTQILINLVTNGNEALEGRAGTITISLARVDKDDIPSDDRDRQLSLFGDRHSRRRVLGELDPSFDYARIDVTDSGKGIPQKIQARIFEPFFTNKRRTGGTGLGLAVVHSIVSNNEGVMYLDSFEGRGTTFSLYFPLMPEPGIENRPSAEPAKIDGTERVLIVDDDVDVADMLSIGLARIGYDVAVSNDPLEALEVFTEDPGAWDIAIVDRMMPQMEGLDLARRLKTIRGDLPIILCTGVDDGTIDPSDSRSFDVFFVKPVSPDRVAAAIRRTVGEYG